MPYADLHVHTRRSDGSLAVDSVPEAARRADVSVVAITDHDRLPPFDAPVVERDGITLVSGIELRVEPADGDRVDLLGYGVRRTDELETVVDEIQRDRRERGQAIVDCVEDRLGIDLGLSVDDGFGRPHVARAVADHPETEYDYQGTFDGLIGSDGPCYVSRTVPSFERGRRVLTAAGEVVSLAHPLRYRDPQAALSLAAELDAVEREYPYGRPVDLEPVDRTIEAQGLVATGGSDAHGETVGTTGLTRSSYRALSLPE